MITMSNFGTKGRLGNQLFQYASCMGLAVKHQTPLVMPAWVYGKYFEAYPYQKTINQKGRIVSEPHYHYAGNYFDHVNYNEVVDLDGYFQTEKYWEHCIGTIMDAFKFKKDFKTKVEMKYSGVLNSKKQLIAVSIRRGDFVNNPNYEQLPITYYFSALEKYFPNWRTNAMVIIFSDDMEYCKMHFQNYSNIVFTESNQVQLTAAKKQYFNENYQAIEQLCLMSLCDHFIISNSTFSWWGAYLGENSKSIIVRPSKTLSGNLAKNNDTKDYYPTRWQEHEAEKIELRDVTFMVPVNNDSHDRVMNLSLNICMLQRHFETNIIIMEQGTNSFKEYYQYGCLYVKADYKVFHRTRMLNDMARLARTSIIVNWDADMFISPLQLLNAVERIRLGVSDVVYPYDGRFARVDRSYFSQLEKTLDVGIFGSTVFNGMRPKDKLSVGGAVIFKRSAYFEGGGENEKFVAYGPEDVEREARFSRLGYKVHRVNGPIYHLDHYKGPNSKCDGNPYDKQNHDELEHIYSLLPNELRAYVNTWPITMEYNGLK